MRVVYISHFSLCKEKKDIFFCACDCNESFCFVFNLIEKKKHNKRKDHFSSALVVLIFYLYVVEIIAHSLPFHLTNLLFFFSFYLPRFKKRKKNSHSNTHTHHHHHLPPQMKLYRRSRTNTIKKNDGCLTAPRILIRFIFKKLINAIFFLNNLVWL